MDVHDYLVNMASSVHLNLTYARKPSLNYHINNI